jgi:hypothetical protein
MTMRENVPGTRMDGPGGPAVHHVPRRRLSTETKASFKTTELLAYLGAVIGVIVMSYLVKTTNSHSDYFRADKAVFYIVILTVGYMVSRGIAKAGSRDFYDDRD